MYKRKKLPSLPGWYWYKSAWSDTCVEWIPARIFILNNRLVYTTYDTKSWRELLLSAPYEWGTEIAKRKISNRKLNVTMINKEHSEI
jgi:hypothetical protein